MGSRDEVSAHIEDLLLWMTLPVLFREEQLFGELPHLNIFILQRQAETPPYWPPWADFTNGRVWFLRALFCADSCGDVHVFLKKKPKQQRNLPGHNSSSCRFQSSKLNANTFTNSLWDPWFPRKPCFGNKCKYPGVKYTQNSLMQLQ